MKKAIITGAGGFIGGALTDMLLEQGLTVYGVGTSAERLERFRGFKNFVPVIADFSVYDRLGEMITDNDIDVFYHLAWQGYGKDTQNFYVQLENVKSTYEAVSAAGKIGCEKFVLAGSSYQYQKNHFNNDPSEKTGLCSIYGASKASAEAYAKVAAHRLGLVFCGALFPHVFGVGDRSERSSVSIIKQLLKGEDLKSTQGDELYDWVYVDDVAGGLRAIGEKGKDGKVYYVGSSCLRPFKEIISQVRDILSPNAKISFGAYPDTSFVDFSDIDIYELYNDTGYYPSCDFETSVRKTAEWLKEQMSREEP